MKRSSFESIDQYISTFPPEVQRLLTRVRKTIRKAAPEATEAIAYQIPTFRIGGNLVHFAAFKNHIGFYPTSSGISAFEDELAGYEYSRGSVQFPLSAKVPLDLIRRVTEFRVAEVARKAKTKAGLAAKARTKPKPKRVPRPPARR
jgi:uncharacterized protein YdhG (YjbR/CyaY superfamily)